MTAERFPVEAGHILIFARAIGDPNPAYSDVGSADRGSGVVAPPTFVQAADHFDPEHARRPRDGEPWLGSGRHATGRPADESVSGVSGYVRGGLHAETHYEYHRAVRAGDVLSGTVAPGRSWEKDGRSGKLAFSESVLEYRDETGELVVTARWVTVRTELFSAVS